MRGESNLPVVSLYMCVCPTAGVDWCFHIFFIPFCLYEQALCYPGGELVTWWWSPVSASLVAVWLLCHWSLFVCCAVFCLHKGGVSPEAHFPVSLPPL